MSLLVWLPLNGNLKNKGIGTLSSDFFISSPTYSAGKTGNNLKISSQQSNVVTIDELTNKKNVTISFWFCSNSGNTFGLWRDVISFGVSNGTTVSPFRMEASSSTGKNFGWFGNGILTTDSGCCWYTLNLDTWYHITIVLNGTTIKKYINGGLQETFTIPTSYANNYYFTGTMTLGDVSMYVSLADVRIYDECLSVKQIKEISKGLVLHYPLNSGYGNENLLVNTYEGYYGNGTVLTDETYNGFKIRYLKYEGTSYKDCIAKSSIISPTANTYYTISFWAKGNCGINNYFYPNNCASGISSDGHATTSVDGNCYISLTPEWKRYWITWKTRSDVSGAKDIVVGRIQNKGTGAECYIAGLKFEEGDKNSVWSPNEADDLYSQLGYDSTTMYDTSGFGNNGVMVNNIIHTSNTPLYDSSINLQRINSNYIDLQNTYITNQSTINLWGKVNTFNNYQRFFEFCNALQGATGSHRITLGTYQSTQQLALRIYGGDTGITSLYVNNITTIDTNWHMYSIVFNKTNLKVFIDGTSIVDATMTQELTSMVRQYSYIGKSSYSGDSYFDGNISDFRIYSTALSAEDIKQLYESRARIDKDGNVYCNQFVESSDMGNSNVDKKGILHTNSLIEIKSEEKCKIYKQDIQSNEIIEI